MSVLPYCPSPCLDPIYFYKGNGFIGCSTTKICTDFYEHPSKKLRSAKYNATYRENGEFTSGANVTICGSLVLLTPGRCDNDSSACAPSCPLENLTLSSLSDVVNHVQSPTVASISSTRSSSTSHSQSFTTSTLFQYNQPTATTAGYPALTSAAAPKSPVAPASNSDAAAIAGGVAGGIAGLALLVGLLAICRRRRKIKSLFGIDKGRFSAWNSGQPRSMQPGSAELDEIKQGPSTSKLLFLLHTIIRKPNSVFLASSPLPPPPAYASYNSHGNGLEGSPDHLHPSSGSQYVSYDVPSPESPPSPPPLKTRLSQQSTSSYSDGQDVSPISPQYQNQPFDNPRSLRSSVYSEVSGGVLHAHAM